jgi:hypothetical protein
LQASVRTVAPRWLSRLIRLLRIAQQNRRFDRWRCANPSKKFRHYFAELERPGLLNGWTHPSLGRNLTNGEFGESGSEALDVLIEHGLTPNDACIDYGCGTLRIGIHVINYLKPHRYFGLDVDELFINEGINMLDEEMIIDRAPRFGVISPETVAEAAAAKPSMLFSWKVLLHVHPDELYEYFQNIVTIIGDDGTALVCSKWGNGNETIQFGGQSWAHPIGKVFDVLTDLDCSAEILCKRASPLPDLGIDGDQGILKIKKSASMF